MDNRSTDNSSDQRLEALQLLANAASDIAVRDKYYGFIGKPDSMTEENDIEQLCHQIVSGAVVHRRCAYGKLVVLSSSGNKKAAARLYNLMKSNIFDGDVEETFRVELLQALPLEAVTKEDVASLLRIPSTLGQSIFPRLCEAVTDFFAAHTSSRPLLEQVLERIRKDDFLQEQPSNALGKALRDPGWALACYRAAVGNEKLFGLLGDTLTVIVGDELKGLSTTNIAEAQIATLQNEAPLTSVLTTAMVITKDATRIPLASILANGSNPSLLERFVTEAAS
jgi:hypothetical protein